MGIIKHIKNKIATVEAYLRSNNAMKSVAAVRINKCKKKMKALNDVKEVSDFFSNKKGIFDKRNYHIIIGCNQGMCGPFLGYISSYIKNFIKENVKEDCFYILGEKFLEYDLHKNISTNKLPLNDISILQIVEEIINQSLLKNKPTDVFLHYYNKNKMVIEHIIKNRDPNLQQDVYDLLNMVNIVMRAIYTSGFHENKERVLALEQAKTNAEKMQKKGYNELNRVRQESITNDLAEIVAGVLL
ncbi:F0F1 ATP synthase subunit gamma [Alphaproteobacteria bacterium endosymbiont of Tiliacea citrago]|uniref:F0F1 ATP synthase subunit gamma n=1 Tax=Alphaproteobacteria bacterium endosymbiont of Tiliacea citrago TaxID=3077944 RepID=UPI00313B7E1C